MISIFGQATRHRHRWRASWPKMLIWRKLQMNKNKCSYNVL